MVGPPQPRQELPLLVGIQIEGKQPFQRRILEPLQRSGELIERLFVESVASHKRRVELGGQVGLLIELLPLMIELQVEPVADQVQCPLRILAISQQCLPVLDFARRPGVHW